MLSGEDVGRHYYLGKFEEGKVPPCKYGQEDDLLILIVISLFYVLYAQQPTAPIIGGKCDVSSADVPIGGKETQFFLKCERSLQSESGKGVWVVKSRILSTTPSIPQTSSPVVVSIDKEQSSQQPYKSDNIICVEDKRARDGDLCSVSSMCLQQEQGQLSANYLQCDQS
ncbi:unnamed protein product [Litomosoides sigmodontis]|uniref:Uncharacterized protein n=1 Tax=Litomosoides sigmodontis TaxID=42156 RepID=A0A3P6SR04_LITSI|nr:unnamed protein product [Litomosoides sigmodontis]